MRLFGVSLALLCSDYPKVFSCYTHLIGIVTHLVPLAVMLLDKFHKLPEEFFRPRCVATHTLRMSLCNKIVESQEKRIQLEHHNTVNALTELLFEIIAQKIEKRLACTLRYPRISTYPVIFEFTEDSLLDIQTRLSEQLRRIANDVRLVIITAFKPPNGIAGKESIHCRHASRSVSKFT